MKELIFLVEDCAEGGYIAKALGESIFTQGETWQELQVQISDAVDCYFEENKPQITV